MQKGHYEKFTSIASNAKMDSLIAHMHRTLIKAIACLTGVMSFTIMLKKHQLPSMTSKHSHLVKRLMVLLVLQSNRGIRYQRNHWLKNVIHLMVDKKS